MKTNIIIRALDPLAPGTPQESNCYIWQFSESNQKATSIYGYFEKATRKQLPYMVIFRKQPESNQKATSIYSHFQKATKKQLLYMVIFKKQPKSNLDF